MNISKFRLACGIGTLLATAAACAVGCGGDDTTVIIYADSGAPVTDATMPVSDGSAGNDAALTPDAPLGDDDDGSIADGGSDTGLTDDAGNPLLPDGGYPDYSAQLTSFQNKLATAYCTQLATACSSTKGGSVTINQTKCVKLLTSKDNPVWNGSTVGIADPNALGHNDIVYVSGAAARCLDDISNMDFTAVTVAQSQKATTDCFAANYGRLPIGASCFDSIECAPNTYCKNLPGSPFDAGPDGGAIAPGVCATLEDAGVDSGTDCTAYSNGVSCSYLGGQTPQAYCDFTADPNSNLEFCHSGLLPDNAPCDQNLSCASTICDLASNTCLSATDPPEDFTAVCGQYTGN